MTAPFLHSFGKLTAVNYEAVAFLCGAFQQSLDSNEASELRHFISAPEAKDVEDDVDLRAFKPIKQGFFRLSLDPSQSPRVPIQGWTAGRGLTLPNKKVKIEVDLVLGRCIDGASKSSDIGALHMNFWFHPQSGALMIKCLSSRNPVLIFEGSEMRTIGFRESRAISQPSTRIQLGRAEYRFEFTIDRSNLNQHFGDLDRHLRSLDHTGSNSVPRFVRAIPGSNTVSISSFNIIIKEHTLAGGSFGMVNEAIDIATGEPRALKRVRLDMRKGQNGDCSRSSILREYQTALELQDRPGIIRTFGLSCEHGFKGEEVLKCKASDEYLFILSDLGFESFGRFDWSRVTTLQRLEIFRHTLHGIYEMHRAGYAHRDIQVGNLLVLSIDPPRGCVMDFGKAKKSGGKAMKSTSIGPIYTVAPEVWAGNGYSEQIDLFSWAVAIVVTLKFDIPWLKDPGRSNGRVNQFGCSQLQIELEMASGGDRDLLSLLSDCLNWSEEDRPSVQQALEHSAWYPLWHHDDQKQFDSESSSKRQKLSEPGTVETVAFSTSSGTSEAS